jgi:hypothetical protein
MCAANLIILFCALRGAAAEGFVEKIESKGLSWTAALLITAVIMVCSLLIAKWATSRGGGPAGSATLLPCSASQNISPLSDGVIYSDSPRGRDCLEASLIIYRDSKSGLIVDIEPIWWDSYTIIEQEEGEQKLMINDFDFSRLKEELL